MRIGGNARVTERVREKKGTVKKDEVVMNVEVIEKKMLRRKMLLYHGKHIRNCKGCSVHERSPYFLMGRKTRGKQVQERQREQDEVQT